MKYIDAEKLIAELRRQKHELKLSIQSQGDYGQSCQIVAYDNIISLIDSLQREQPEHPTKGYDEAYLNEKIAKASKTWKGVDVDKYMAEMRGYEQPCEDLEEAVSEQICIAADKHIKRVVDAAEHPGWDWTTQDIADAFKAGTMWMKDQITVK